MKVKITQQNNRGGKRDNKTKIVDTKMRNKKTMKNESPSMESWNRIGATPAIALVDWRVGYPAV